MSPQDRLPLRRTRNARGRSDMPRRGRRRKTFEEPPIGRLSEVAAIDMRQFSKPGLAAQWVGIGASCLTARRATPFTDSWTISQVSTGFWPGFRATKSGKRTTCVCLPPVRESHIEAERSHNSTLFKSWPRETCVRPSALKESYAKALARASAKCSASPNCLRSGGRTSWPSSSYTTSSNRPTCESSCPRRTRCSSSSPSPAGGPCCAWSRCRRDCPSPTPVLRGARRVLQ